MHCRPSRAGRLRARRAQRSIPPFQDSLSSASTRSAAGSVEVLGIAFASLDNTLSISAGTLTLAYWDELNGPSTILLSAAMGAS